MSRNLLKILIEGTVAVSATTGVIAFVKQEIERKKEKACGHRQGIYEKYIKRPVDCAVATGASIVLAPVFLVTSFLVKWRLGSPVLFVQERPGKDEKIFRIYKFRTMRNAKDKDGNELPDEERLTKFGTKLRSLSIDELPELLNIIKGDMAIVGPRPLLVEYLPRYNKKQARRHEVRPGLTGLAQVNGRNSISWEEKFDWDVKYVDNVTFMGDLMIILGTIKAVLKREGISSGTNVTMEAFMGSSNSSI